MTNLYWYHTGFFVLPETWLYSMSVDIQPSMKQFWQAGFVVFPNLVDTALTDALLRVAPHLKYHSIFKDVYSDEEDENRFQAHLKQKQIRDIANVIQHSIINLVPEMGWEMRKWVILKSLPNGDEQQCHRDFPMYEVSRARALKDSIQAGLLLGLMPDTKLILYRHDTWEVHPEDRQELVFGAGDCVIFRGDLIHAGASYPIDNYRVHSTITVDTIAWNEDATEPVPYVQYKCAFCVFRTAYVRVCEEHEQSCPFQPANINCQFCSTRFTSSNHLYKHLSRMHASEFIE